MRGSMGDQLAQKGLISKPAGPGGGGQDKCPKCGRPKKPEFSLCFQCSQAARGAQASGGGGTGASLPEGSVFDTFYGADGKLRLEVFFGTPEQVAAAFKASGYTASSFRRLYQGFLGFAAPLRDGRISFATARERFGVLYNEGVVRQETRGVVKPVVKQFVDRHRETMLKSREEMLGFFRYLTNVYCHFGDKE